MLGAGKIFLSVKMMEIGGMLKRGNKKSQEIGESIENVVRLYSNDEVKFQNFINDIESEYNRASKRYNEEFYQKAGGKLGSGELKTLHTEDASNRLGIDLEKMVNGLDPEGFMQFQAFVPFITDASYGKIPLTSPEDGPSFPFMMGHLRLICWYILFSVYYEDCREYLKSKINKHKWVDPSLN